jgi:hypothetical protein
MKNEKEKKRKKERSEVGSSEVLSSSEGQNLA